MDFEERFQPNLSMVSQAFDDSHTSGRSDFGASSAPSDNLEALNLPNLDSFMHSSF